MTPVTIRLDEEDILGIEHARLLVTRLATADIEVTGLPLMLIMERLESLTDRVRDAHRDLRLEARGMVAEAVERRLADRRMVAFPVREPELRGL